MLMNPLTLQQFIESQMCRHSKAAMVCKLLYFTIHNSRSIITTNLTL